MEETALTSINKILKVLNEQDEEVWGNQAEIKYTQREADKLDLKTKKLLKKIKRLETENAEIEAENKRLEGIIEQEKCSIETAKMAHLMLISKQKDNVVSLKSWTDKCNNVLKEHAKNYEEYEQSLKKNSSYVKLKEAENDYLNLKIKYGILKNKLDTMIRISKQKEEMSWKIYTSTVVNFAKTCLDYNRNKNIFIKTKEMEAKYKQLVETYHNVQTKVLQKELELDKKNRVANVNKNFKKISQLGTQDSLLLKQQTQEMNTSNASLDPILQSSVADANVENCTKMSFKTSFADFAKNALMQSSTTFKKPQQRNILGPITASFHHQNERLQSTGRQQEKLKIYNEGPNPNNVTKETFTNKDDTINFFMQKSENIDLEKEFLSPKPVMQKNSLKRLCSSEQPSPKRRVLTFDPEQKIKLTETVDSVYFQKNIPSENFSSQKLPENNTIDEDHTLNTAQIFESLIICSQPDESKNKSEIKSPNYNQTKQHSATVNQNYNLSKEQIKTPVTEPENSTETVKNNQGKSVTFQTQINQNYTLLQRSVNTTQKSNEIMKKPDNTQIIQSSTREPEKSFTFDRNFAPTDLCRNFFGKNITAPSVNETEVNNKPTENFQENFVSFQKQQETFVENQSDQNLVLSRQFAYPNQKNNEAVIKPDNGKTNQFLKETEHNFDPFLQNQQPTFATNFIFPHQSQKDSETLMNPDNKKLSQSSTKEPETSFNLEHNFIPSFMTGNGFGKNITNQSDNNVTLNANNASFNVSFQEPGQLSTFIDERAEGSGSFVFPFSPEDNSNNNNVGGNFLF